MFEIVLLNSKLIFILFIDVIINFGKIEIKIEEIVIEFIVVFISNVSKLEEIVIKWEKGIICCSFYILVLFIFYL